MTGLKKALHHTDLGSRGEIWDLIEVRCLSNEDLPLPIAITRDVNIHCVTIKVIKQFFF